MTIGVVDMEGFSTYGAHNPGDIWSPADTINMGLRGWSVSGQNMFWADSGLGHIDSIATSDTSWAYKQGLFATSFGFRFKASGSPLNNEAFCTFDILQFNTDLAMSLHAKGTTGTLSVVSPFFTADTSAVIADNISHYIEIEFFLTAAGGGAVFIDIFVDGISVVSGPSGLNAAQPHIIDMIFGYTTTNFITYNYSHMYWAIDPLAGQVSYGGPHLAGPSYVFDSLPNANGTHQNFSPVPAGTAYTKINNSPQDALTSYIQAPNIGDKATFTTAGVVPPAFLAHGVTALLVGAIADKDRLPARAIEPVVISDGRESDQGETALQGSGSWTPLCVKNVWEISPSNTAWTGATANAAEIGITISS